MTPPNQSRIRIALLGSTGSIGTQTLDVIRAHPDRFELVTIAAGSNVRLLQRQVAEFHPHLVNLDLPSGIACEPQTEIVYGNQGLVACAVHHDVDVVVVATSGIASLNAVLEAARCGKRIALANKEALVCAADVILPVARDSGAEIRPVDSEHSAIWQSMGALKRVDVRRLILTASGGPFRTMPLEQLRTVTARDALKHPTWTMGAKITIDSATLVNKGLEIIEAHRLFDIPYDQIDAVIHPESIIHSLVEFLDGSTIAQLSVPDMRLPIQYALTAPEHAPRDATPLDLAKLGSMTFSVPDHGRFPALTLCRHAGEVGGSTCTALCAADEIAVESFIAGKIGFTAIPVVLERTLERHSPFPIGSLDDVQGVLSEATAVAKSVVASL